ncbi:GGDEF domain-containing protein [Ciceribacter ferrooxidans]|uniref:diguanylate cyclase n=1 Tax=Ciceribacter ferrooxidans TaxID=2509717 RepID=A0A4Q2TJP2_9HYPH|nr:GGDEF domain-containing protein [Ciceribacter ferrooxidans]RYC17755.1 GGDEF domain-containing protein [Ciceribacter ferrooxidans]
MGHRNEGTASAENEATDRLQRVTQAMARLKVDALPRNYELFHEALFGHDPALARDVASLAASPPQHALDRIGLAYRLTGHCGLIEEKSCVEAARVLSGAADEMAAAIREKQAFVKAMETILHSVREDRDCSVEDLLADIDFLQSSAAELLRSESRAEQALKAGLDRLDAAERAARAAKAEILRDRLTGLPNRIAFANRIESLYESGELPHGVALLIADIDGFGAVNRDYGTESGNRILKRLAAILRKSIKKNDFVARIGADEFAFLFAEVDIAAARAIAGRIHDSVENGLVFATAAGEDNGALGLSIGIALSDGAESAQHLVSQAEQALTVAKADPRAPIACFAPGVSGRRAA